jgi:hypothetical protein
LGLYANCGFPSTIFRNARMTTSGSLLSSAANPFGLCMKRDAYVAGGGHLPESPTLPSFGRRLRLCTRLTAARRDRNAVAGRRLTVREKLHEYRASGVLHIWLVEPHSRRLDTCDEEDPPDTRSLPSRDSKTSSPMHSSPSGGERSSGTGILVDEIRNLRLNELDPKPRLSILVRNRANAVRISV